MPNHVPVHRQSGRYITMVSWRKAIWGTPWKHCNGVEGYENWEERLAASQRSIAAAMSN